MTDELLIESRIVSVDVRPGLRLEVILELDVIRVWTLRPTTPCAAWRAELIGADGRVLVRGDAALDTPAVRAGRQGMILAKRKAGVWLVDGYDLNGSIASGLSARASRRRAVRRRTTLR